jgi:site-specific DNA-methyltransferase (adenine-specific)
VIDLRLGDCLETLRAMPDSSVHSVITDPPYGLGKEPNPRDVLRAWLDGEEFKPGGAGFMGRAWDAFVPSPLVWAECLRVLKPGGHLLAFAGSRTYDWIVMGVRLAGFEVRDQLIWMYGSGFPKSHNIANGAKSMCAGIIGAPNMRPELLAECDALGDGIGTALKPAHEPILLARKPLGGLVAANVLTHGTGALNVDACRVGTEERSNPFGCPGANNVRLQGGDGRDVANAKEYAAASKLLPPTDVVGRWPANILHDGSPEVLAVFPETTSGTISPHHLTRTSKNLSMSGANQERTDREFKGDSGSAARFFYCAKASRAERELGLEDFTPETVGDGRQKAIDNAYQRGKTERRNTHPTVKPVSVMRWLCRLATPIGGTILDPYTGSGTTGVAAALEGFDFIGCELSPEYVALARARIAHAREFPAMWAPDYQAHDEVPAEQLGLFS